MKHLDGLTRSPHNGPAGGGRSPRNAIRSGRGLYLIVTSPNIPHDELVRAAVERRVPVVQLREKDAPADEVARLASELRGVTTGTDTLLIVNDRPEAALEALADGVHVGRDDTRPEEARLLMGDSRVLGVSGNTVEEARAAQAAGADYLGLGPVFPTSTKQDARTPVGLGGLARVATEVPDLPIVAVGGIDASNAASVVRAGAAYVAVVSAICFADDPVLAMDELLAVLSDV
jgi:thiamine-phosphate pyrophosphorylase